MKIKWLLAIFLLALLPLVAQAEKKFSFAPDSGIGGFSFGFMWPADLAAPGKNLVALEGESSRGAGFTAIAWAAGGEVVAETRVFQNVMEGEAILIFETETKKDITAATGAFRSPHFGLVIRPDAKPRRTLLYTIDAFALPAHKAEATTGPVALYTDKLETVVFSPLDRFLVAMQAPQPDGSWLCGFEGLVEKIPAGTKLREIAVSGRGVNDTIVFWGAMLRAYHHRQRADEYADVGLSRLGYWTDNGGYYYYKTAPGKNYHQTLIAVRDDARRRGIPFGYFQIDSWWYPKSKSDNSIIQAFRGGSLLWEPIPELFPQGLPAFQKELGLPLTAHNRWYNVDSPYCKKYRCAVGTGDKRPALPIDPAFWDEIMDNAVKYGVQVYEQEPDRAFQPAECGVPAPRSLASIAEPRELDHRSHDRIVDPGSDIPCMRSHSALIRECEPRLTSCSEDWKLEDEMDCPVCGCGVARPASTSQLLVECECCGTVWVLAAETLLLERVLVGPEG